MVWPPDSPNIGQAWLMPAAAATTAMAVAKLIRKYSPRLA
jgi:hypothetical protein